MKKTKRLTVLAITVSAAMVLSFVESQIPALISVPGVKAGLANIAVIFALYRLGIWEAASVSLVRVLLSGLLFGSAVSLIYSAAGAIVSLGAMLLLRKTNLFGTPAVSVVGGVCHNAVQIAVASLILETNVIVYYLPALIISGTLAGIAVGLAASLLIKRIKL